MPPGTRAAPLRKDVPPPRPPRWPYLVSFALLAGCGLYLLRNPRLVSWLERRSPPVYEPSDRIDERAAKSLFDLPRIGHDYVYDPVALLVMKPDLLMEWPWPEGPGGKITMRTNSLGLREDEPTALEKPGLRILVAGDSHTAGVIDNALTFANRLEARLRALPGRETLEVLNAGVGYTGPYCYRAMLEKHLGLRPDVFVAVLYTGNDFWDDLRIRLALEGRTPPWPDEAYRARLTRAFEHELASSSQGYNQAFRFKNFPAELEYALAAVTESFLGMRDRCAELGIAFLAVVLPTKMDVEPEDDGAALEFVRRELALDPEEAAVNRTLGRRFAEAMSAAGVRCLDPFESMRAAPHPLYWHEDYHLGDAGHALLAKLLFAELQARL